MRRRDEAGSGVWRTAFLALRSLLWVALLPGVIAGYVPLRFFGLDRVRLDVSRPAQVIGLVCAGAGAALLAVCVWEFARTGLGTLAPVDPPRRLVARGPYRHVRNPMYLGVVTIVLGEALVAGSGALAAYGAAFVVAANLFIVGYEEPSLRRRFGESYDQYSRQVRRWLPRWKPSLGDLDAPHGERDSAPRS